MPQMLINRITHSELARVKASTVFGTKYCKAAPAIINRQENSSPLAGTARFDKVARACGACRPRARPNSIRLVENTPLFIEDITEDNTTRFIIIAEVGIPACRNNDTNGLRSAGIWFHGVTDITTNKDST